LRLFSELAVVRAQFFHDLVGSGAGLIAAVGRE
jgi:hypothetical protein